MLVFMVLVVRFTKKIGLEFLKIFTMALLRHSIAYKSKKFHTNVTNKRFHTLAWKMHRWELKINLPYTYIHIIYARSPEQMYARFDTHQKCYKQVH